MNPNDKYCTVDEYFKLKDKDKESLTPIEELKILNFKAYIRLAKQNEDYLSDEVLDNLNEYRQKKALLMAQNSDKNIDKLPKSPDNIIPLKKPNDTNIEEKPYTRTLSKTGYINASIMLIVILNIGFIVALSMIFMR